MSTGVLNMRTESPPKAQVIAPRPWWKEPIMWLVVGGPLTAVIAGLTTVYIAVSNPDPVLDRTEAGSANMVPAHQARNHAASPSVKPAASAEKQDEKR